MSPPERTLLKNKGFAQRVGFGSSPAVLVVDFINGFTNPRSPLGSEADEAIEQTNRLVLEARAQSLPVFFSTIRYEEPGCVDAGIWISKIAGLQVLSSETDGSQLDSRLLWQPGDPIIVKKYASCFFGTDLASRLLARRVDTLILAGCTTSGCIRATAVDACQYGFRTIVAQEAVTDRSAVAHSQSLVDIDLKYGDVVSVEEVVVNLAKLNRSAAG